MIFILSDEPSGGPRKILARNHQFLGVKKAVEMISERKAQAGKAMLVCICIDKINCVQMYGLIAKYWNEHISELEKGLPIDLYSEDEVTHKAEDVFRHVFWAYPTLPSPFYEAVEA